MTKDSRDRRPCPAPQAMRRQRVGAADAAASPSTKRNDDGASSRRPGWYSVRLEAWTAVAARMGLALPWSLARHAMKRPLPTDMTGTYRDLRWSAEGLSRTTRDAPLVARSLRAVVWELLCVAFSSDPSGPFSGQLMEAMRQDAGTEPDVREVAGSCLDAALAEGRPLRADELAVLVAFVRASRTRERVLIVSVPTDAHCMRLYLRALREVLAITEPGEDIEPIVDRLAHVLERNAAAQCELAAEMLQQCLGHADATDPMGPMSARIGELMCALARVQPRPLAVALCLAQGVAQANLRATTRLQGVLDLAAGPLPADAREWTAFALLRAVTGVPGDDQLTTTVRTTARVLGEGPGTTLKTWMWLASALLELTAKLGRDELRTGLEIVAEVRALCARCAGQRGADPVVLQTLAHVLGQVPGAVDGAQSAGANEHSPRSAGPQGPPDREADVVRNALGELAAHPEGRAVQRLALLLAEQTATLRPFGVFSVFSAISCDRPSRHAHAGDLKVRVRVTDVVTRYAVALDSECAESTNPGPSARAARDALCTMIEAPNISAASLGLISEALFGETAAACLRGALAPARALVEVHVLLCRHPVASPEMRVSALRGCVSARQLCVARGERTLANKLMRVMWRLGSDERASPEARGLLALIIASIHAEAPGSRVSVLALRLLRWLDQEAWVLPVEAEATVRALLAVERSRG